MPIYEYKCNECGRVFEVIQSIKEDELEICDKCNGKLEKLISKSSFRFKGDGFPTNDMKIENSLNALSTDKKAIEADMECLLKNK